MDSDQLVLLVSGTLHQSLHSLNSHLRTHLSTVAFVAVGHTPNSSSDSLSRDIASDINVHYIILPVETVPFRHEKADKLWD